VRPIEFPGGNIGKLAVCGTVNDLAVSGAKPLWLSCGFIIEEGLNIETLERIVKTMADEAKKAGVMIVCGDTKVIERRSADSIYINTSGIGKVVADLSPDKIREGDKIIINGDIADHGIAIMTARKELKIDQPVESDCASLGGLALGIIDTSPNLRCMRDPTRGGLAATLNEWVENKDICIELNEQKIPIKESTRAICELLGFDPLSVANEGKILAVVPADEAEAALDAIRKTELGKSAAIIGEATQNHPGKVILKTAFGTSRIVSMPSGELLPRIC
jgi:hydrogenase expression/formation protein HypE